MKQKLSLQHFDEVLSISGLDDYDTKVTKQISIKSNHIRIQLKRTSLNHRRNRDTRINIVINHVPDNFPACTQDLINRN